MPDPDDKNKKLGLVLFEDDPKAPHSQAEQILDVPPQAFDIVFQGLRILGQDDEFRLDDPLMRAVDP
jgi:hypothetical protein